MAQVLMSGRDPRQPPATLSPTGVCLLGTGSGSGKTWHGIALIGALRAAGQDPVPFKPIAVLDPADGTSRDPRPWARAIHHHLMAAGLPYSPDYNPLTVVPTSDTAGMLHVLGDPRGIVRLAGPDQVDFDAMPGSLYEECVAVVAGSLAACRRTGSFVVLEGAGDSGSPGSAPNVANVVAPALAGFPVLVVFRPDRSVYLTLGAYWRCLEPQIRSLVRAVIINNPSNAALPADLAASPVPAAVARGVDLPPSDGSVIQQRIRNRALAEHVWAALPWSAWLFGRDETDLVAAP